MKIQLAILNGPNLNSIGVREPHIYGSETLSEIPKYVDKLLQARAENVELSYFQSNSEGLIIDHIEALWRNKNIHGMVFNAGAYTHTSLAIADCLAWTKIPCVEVHISNILARQNRLRHNSLIATYCIGTMAGFGLFGYALGVAALLEYLSKN